MMKQKKDFVSQLQLLPVMWKKTLCQGPGT